MTPEERIARASELELEMVEEAKALLEQVPRRDPNSRERAIDALDWKHLPRPVLIAFILFLVGTVSSLGTAVLNLRKTDLDSLRAEVARNRGDIEALKGDLREWNARWGNWIATLETNTNAMHGLAERVDSYREEQLRAFIAAARRRGDAAEAERLDRTLDKIVAGKNGGQ